MKIFAVLYCLVNNDPKTLYMSGTVGISFKIYFPPVEVEPTGLGQRWNQYSEGEISLGLMEFLV